MNTEVRDTRYEVQGTRFKVRGARYEVRDTRYEIRDWELRMVELGIMNGNAHVRYED